MHENESMTQRSVEEAIESPIFIVCSERSGSTMLWLMLDSHPAISMAGQMEYAVHFDFADGWPDPVEYEQFLQQDSMFMTSGFTADMTLEFPELMRSFLRQRLDAAPAPYVGAAVHEHFDRLKVLWPRARFIHLVRDGRDVAESFKGRGWVGHPYSAAQTWVDCQEMWTQLERELDQNSSIEIRYEDLVRNPEEVLTEVCSFIGVAYTDEMYAYSVGSEYERPRADLAEQWRGSMSARTVSQLETVMGPTLAALGYERATTGQREIGRIERASIEAQDATSKFRDRLDRFGVGLSLKFYLTALPGLRSRRPGVLEEMGAVRRSQRKRHWSDDASQLQ